MRSKRTSIQMIDDEMIDDIDRRWFRHVLQYFKFFEASKGVLPQQLFMDCFFLFILIFELFFLNLFFGRQFS